MMNGRYIKEGKSFFRGRNVKVTQGQNFPVYEKFMQRLNSSRRQKRFVPTTCFLIKTVSLKMSIEGENFIKSSISLHK